MTKIPGDWLPNVNMDRIILHWTAGTHKANSVDKKHYHILIEGDGNLVRGKYSILANAKPIRGRYAAHTRNCNTRSIGVAFCCMHGATEVPFNSGGYPLKKEQWDIAVKVFAQLCQFYTIPVTPETVLSHAEVEATLGIKQRNKWDVARLSFDLKLKGAKRIGDEFRRQVQREIDSSFSPPRPPDDPGVDVGAHVLPMRTPFSLWDFIRSLLGLKT